jgi:hypothetical protein
MNRRTVLVALIGLVAIPAQALYDPKPDEGLASVQGEWSGSLTYRDYGKPDRMVTLQTRLFVALSAPSELVFHYVFADGPGKTVYSYEKMRFDFGARRVAWESGIAERSQTAFAIVSNATEGGIQTIVFERKNDQGVDRYRMVLAMRGLTIAKDEIQPDGTVLFRNKLEFKRGGN